MKNFLAIIFILVVGVGLYGATARGDRTNADVPEEYQKSTQVGQAFESSHERSPWAMLLAMRQNGTVELTKQLADFSSPDVAYINKKFYSFFPPGIPVLIMPLYIWGSGNGVGLLAAFATMPLIAIGSLILIYLISRQIFTLPRWSALFAALLFGFASTSWSYAVTIYQHTPLVFLMLLAFYTTWQFKKSGAKSGWFWAIIAGASYGLAVFVDYPAAVLVLPAVAYLLLTGLRGRTDGGKLKVSLRFSVLFGIATIVILAAVHMYYNASVFGSAFQFHNPAPRYTTETYDKLLAAEAGEQKASPGQALNVFNEYALANGSFRLLVASDKGLFFFSAVFILALFGFHLLVRRAKLEAIIWISFAAVNFFMYASFHDPWGGWAFGPRYLIPAMAVLSVSAGAAIGVASTWWKRLIAFVLVAYSSAIALIGVLTTNLVPPKVEADFLKLKYNFLRNWDFLQENTSGSYVYNHYLKGEMSLQEYFYILYGVIMAVFFIVLFILPLFGKKKNEAGKEIV